MKEIHELTYEEAFEELEQIVRRLEEEAHSLEMALQLYERGQALAAHCRRLLEQAELKVQQIADGELRPFDEAGGGGSV